MRARFEPDTGDHDINLEEEIMPQVATDMLPENFRRVSIPDIHPTWRQAETAFEAFARRTGVIEDEADTKLMLSFGFGRFTGWCFPSMPQPKLDLLTQWHYMFTLIDDVGDATTAGTPQAARELCGHILQGLPSPVPPQRGGPAATAFHDLWWRTAATQDEAWRQRARADLAIYLDQFVEQRDNRRYRRIMCTDDYIELRRHSVGLDANANVLEALLDIKLPEPLFAQGPFRHLRDCWVDANAWLNDYYSYEREATNGEDHNLAIVLAHNEDLLHEQALARVLEMINRRLNAFLRLERKLPRLVAALGYGNDFTSEVLRYTQALRDYTYGHVAWSSTSSRYNEEQLRATDWASVGAGNCVTWS